MALCINVNSTHVPDLAEKYNEICLSRRKRIPNRCQVHGCKRRCKIVSSIRMCFREGIFCVAMCHKHNDEDFVMLVKPRYIVGMHRIIDKNL